MKLKIARVIIFVRDVPGTAIFYKDAFGLKVKNNIDKEWTELEGEGCNLALHRTPVKGKKCDSGIKIVFGTKNVAAAKKKLEAKGIRMGKIFEYEGMKFCDGKDPDGNTFQISDR